VNVLWKQTAHSLSAVPWRAAETEDWFLCITGDVADASVYLLNQFNCLLVPRAGCFSNHWIEDVNT